MMGDPSFVNVLQLGTTCVVAVGALVCAGLLLWIAVLLSQIEKNQRSVKGGGP